MSFLLSENHALLCLVQRMRDAKDGRGRMPRSSNSCHPGLLNGWYEFESEARLLIQVIDWSIALEMEWLPQ